MNGKVPSPLESDQSLKNLYLIGTAGGSFQQTKETWWGIEDFEDTEGHFTTSGQVNNVWKRLMVGLATITEEGLLAGWGSRGKHRVMLVHLPRKRMFQ